MPPVFNDLFKSVKDLLTKNYCGDTHKVEIKTKDQITFNPTFTRAQDGTVASNWTVEGECQPCDYATLKGKYGINTKGMLNIKLNVDEQSGNKLEANADLMPGEDLKKDAYSLKAERKARDYTATSQLNYEKTKLVLGLSGVYAHQAMRFGAQATVNDLAATQTMKSALGVAYDVSKDTSVVGLLENMTKLKLGFITKSSGYTLGGEYLLNNVNDFKAACFTLGMETKLQDGQVLKAKLDSKGVLSASIQHKLTPVMKWTSSFETDGAAKSKFGTHLMYES
eukprot:NODE_3465_length_962_cov_62.414371_g3316_i0.p1 GENE.NODE_3465_length_962_cov_62.414371_g3316_i0~~NODE_3465_length_962_cov_62.414371_g3316_i0.p1  ORF type:complete len:301 (+),score=114.28 NODE_3465_length_962_cov_62.414371_g3316_i0:62-904(+)